MRFTKLREDIIQEGNSLNLNEQLGIIDRILNGTARMIEEDMKKPESNLILESLFSCLYHVRNVLMILSAKQTEK